MREKIILIMLLCSLFLFAANNAQQYLSDDYSYNNGIFTFNKNYVWTDFASRIDKSFETKSKISVNDISELGYYLVDETGERVGNYITLYNRDDQIHNAAIFEKDQKIGIYMNIDSTLTTTSKHWVWTSPITGKFVTETTTITENNRYTTSNTDDSLKAGTNIDPDSFKSNNQYFCLFPQGEPSGAHYEYYFNGLVSGNETHIDEFMKKIYGDDYVVDPGVIKVIYHDEYYKDPLEGQPLPGVLATFFVGGLTIVGLKFRKKKKK